MKVICTKALLRKNGKDKGKELFTEDRTYMVCQNGLLPSIYGLGDITLLDNFNKEHSFSNDVFREHFEHLF